MMAGERYRQVHRRSIEEREVFWSAQAARIDWRKAPDRVLDDSKLPFAHWFPGGTTSLCHNAVDRHLATRADQNALVYVSTETDETRTFTYRQLHREVNRVAGMLRGLGVGKGDRVLIYMPMVPEAIFAMLATVRLGAIHSVVFGGFAASSLAARIDDARPSVVVTADAGMRSGKVIPLKPLLDEALSLSTVPPPQVLLFNRGLAGDLERVASRDHDWAALRAAHMNDAIECEWVESSHPSYILYTSGTTGKPKGVQRDTGGYAVALASSMEYIYCSKPGDTWFCTSDIGWVVGHSYIVYAPLINGSTTILYEGLPIRPDAGIWWKIVQDWKVTGMFSSPTAIRVLKKQDPSWLTKYDLSSLRYLFLAGEPLDEPTSDWISSGLGVPVIDNYWQTETGWPILTAQPGIEDTPRKLGSPSFATYGYQLELRDEQTGKALGSDQKGVLCIVPPLPPGCMSTVWGDDKRFLSTYFSSFEGESIYSTFDWATRDADGYYFILGRTDDVINVAGHRLGTREIEEAVQTNANVAECAVVGVADSLKGQVPIAFAVLKDVSRIADEAGRATHEAEVQRSVDTHIGAIGRPTRVHFVTGLPKTRSGKLLRRAIQALAEGRDPGDLTTIEDPGSLEQIRQALGAHR
jgi:propionyl-CoA synthetase